MSENAALITLGGLFASRDPVRIAQRLIAAEASDADRLAIFIATIFVDDLWRQRRGPKGLPFGTAAQFVVAPAPYGLNVRTDDALRKLRRALIAKRLYREWIAIRTGVVRPRGHPKAKIAHSEESPPVFSPSRSSTSIDQILPRLMRDHEELFKRVEAGEISVNKAGVLAGIVPHRPKRQILRFGTVDLCALRRLTPRAQKKLLRMVSDAAKVDAQCALLASRVDAVVGQSIAQIWRDHGKKTGNTGEPSGHAP